MSTVEGWTLESVNPEDINATDLRQECKEAETAGEPLAPYRLWKQESAECAWMVFFPGASRAGISWGADAQWTDAKSPEEAVRRWATDTLVG
jgi:hypothetical protein